MKKFISMMSLMVGLLGVCVAFSACSSNDESENSGSNSSKRIVKILEEEDGELSETVFSYDSQGRLIKAVGTVNSSRRESYVRELTYQYGDMTIISRETERSWSETHTYTLSNNRIVKDVEVQSGDPTTTIYTYDDNGYMTSQSASGRSISDYTDHFVWTNGNLTFIDREFKYSNIPWHKNMFFYFKGSNMDPYLWAGGYWGKTPKNMPSLNVDYDWTYDYEVKNGLVSKMKIIDNKSGKVKYVASYIWE